MVGAGGFMIDQSTASAATSELTRRIREDLAVRLLDFTSRNPLLNMRTGPRTATNFRVVDELPGVLADYLAEGRKMRFQPLPALDERPRDEGSLEFQNALAHARLADAEYLQALADTGAQDDDETGTGERGDAEDGSDQERLDREAAAEFALRDRVRQQLGMPPHQGAGPVSLTRHARNNHISPSFDLPEAGDEHGDGRHRDNDIQTLMLPDVLERRLGGLISRSRTEMQETGINVLHAAFGFLEWGTDQRRQFAPLILMPVALARTRTVTGPEFTVQALEGEAESNQVLAEMLRRGHGITLPALDRTAGVEAYFQQIAGLKTGLRLWQVRRQVAFGVFPSARMAMYRDLRDNAAGFAAHQQVASLLSGGAGGDSVGLSEFAENQDMDDPAVEAKVPHTVLDADASQFSTLVDIADGRNLAVEGPPGTGKSQTIVNAIAAAMFAGKKVLFVAEKLAALNVVKNRLDALGLGEFALTLQADRSGRTAVIDGLRARCRMRADRNRTSQAADRQAYRQARDDIATYLAVLRQSVGPPDHQVTVHDILGASIATDHLVRGLPMAIRDHDIAGALDLTGADMDQIAALGDAVAACNRAALAAPPYWAGHGMTDLNRLATEPVQDRARQAAHLYREQASVAARLNGYLPDDGTRRSQVDVARLVQVLTPLVADGADGAENVGPDAVSLQLLERAARQGPQAGDDLLADDAIGLRHLLQFHDHLTRWLADQQQLRQVLDDPTMVDGPDQFREMADICDRFGLGGPAAAHVDHARTDLMDRARADRAISAALTEFLAAEPALRDTPVGALGQAAEMLAAMGDDRVLALRHAAMLAPDAAERLKAGRQMARTIDHRRREMDAILPVENPLSDHDWQDVQAELADTGLLRLFRPGYHRARRRYMAHSHRRKFGRDEAVAHIRQLLTRRAEVRAFRHDADMLVLLGDQFRGVDTEFGRADAVLDFLDRVDVCLPGPECHNLRDFLRNRPVDDLRRLPRQPADHNDLRPLARLDQDVARFDEMLTALDGAARLLEALTRHVPDPARIPARNLNRLADMLDSFLAEMHALNQHPVGRIIPQSDTDTFPGVATDLRLLGPVLPWAQVLVDLADHPPSLTACLHLFRQRCLVPFVADGKALSVSAERAASALNALCDQTGQARDHFTRGRDAAGIAEFLGSAAADQDGLMVHGDHMAARRTLADAGFRWLLPPDAAAPLPAGMTALGDVARALIHRARARVVHRRFGKVLGRYGGRTLTDLRTRLAALDDRIITAGRDQVRNHLLARAQPPAGQQSSRAGERTEMNLIRREMEKKTRHVPVRDLTARAGRALRELQPCWMMSPLSVAQYLPLDGADDGPLFDLCIIDEASQMTPENALGAIARSRQVVVVGDARQLPPSDFFRRTLKDDTADTDRSDDGTADEPLEESVLEMANHAFHPRRQLRWHYRSRHADLIRFSSHVMYDDQLVIFPAADQDRPDMGVGLVSVPGTYKSGLNAVEAEAIASAAITFMQTQVADGFATPENPGRSLGVVTMNSQQRDLLDEDIERAAAQSPAARQYLDFWAGWENGLDAFFVKNLENVQGDERDVIYIGTVYGPAEPGGAVAQRFGPVNQPAGQRRLNVLFSRARCQMLTFSSMTAADISATRDTRPGAWMLKRWLEYSATGRLHGGEYTGREPDSDFERHVIRCIRDMGFIAEPQIGVHGYRIDIGVRHPDWPHGFLLGVECDGARYHSAPSARERDRLRQSVLEGLGWHFHRIWSTDWFNDPSGQTARLRQAIDHRLAMVRAADRAPVSPVADDTVQGESLGGQPA